MDLLVQTNRTNDVEIGETIKGFYFGRYLGQRLQTPPKELNV